ncbi:FAD:protein FMN transferase [Verrucomicrobium spinosum]|uniref:FAD:protein FMN transferase n=1 Tax=Verrucomicrobium spinosum TaxID=2736 RepID=UPI0001745D98|nr:FAD:protein FMN transferase [Verrucomicrobium spinosum]
MPEYNRIKRARPLLGTLVEITLEGKRDEKTLHTLAGAAFTEIERVHRLMSFHDPHSDISRLNTDGRGRPVPLHPWTIEVLRCAENLKNDTAGLFDVCIAGSLLHLGYLPGQGTKVPPLCRFGIIKLYDNHQARLYGGAYVDVGGIAKGFAVDKAVDILRGIGGLSGIVNAGGDLRVFGAKSQLVNLRDPSEPGTSHHAIQLKDGALATTGSYFSRKKLPEGAWVAPLIHPHTRRANPGSRSVTVAAPTAMLADALTKVAWFARAEDSARLLKTYRASGWVLGKHQEVVPLTGKAA